MIRLLACGSIRPNSQDAGIKFANQSCFLVIARCDGRDVLRVAELRLGLIVKARQQFAPIVRKGFGEVIIFQLFENAHDDF